MSSPRASSSSSACTACAASTSSSAIILSEVNGPCVLAYLVTRPLISSSARSFQNVRLASSSSTCVTASASNNDAMSVLPKSRSSTSGSMDSNCVLRSACGTSYWYITEPTKPNSIFSANGDGVSVATSDNSIVPVFNPFIIVRNAGRSYTSCRHSRAVSSSRGKFLRVRAAFNSCAAFNLCCHSGTRLPGRVRGRKSDLAAHSRNRAM